MSTVTFAWHNPDNPKCRSCAFWIGLEGKLYNMCTCKEAKIFNRLRYHKDKACQHFVLKEGVQEKTVEVQKWRGR